MFRWFQETVSCAPVGSLFVFYPWLWLCGGSKIGSFCGGLFFNVSGSGCVMCDVCDTLLSAVFFFFVLLNVFSNLE
jgi:hypothetical protein